MKKRIFQSIELKFTPESLLQVLSWGSNPDSSPYTHEEIANWCAESSNEFMDVDCEPAFDKALSIAASVDCQWDLYLANTFSTTELQTMDFCDTRLPSDWFKAWIEELENRRKT